MISHAHALDRKIKKSNIEEIFERLCIPKTDQTFAEILAEYGMEIRSNPLFGSYIKNIGDKENEYRQKSDIASILQKATYTPTGQQASDQKMLTRKERISEYFSLWSVLRFHEVYDISLHEQVRSELIAKNDLRDLADFEAGVIVISNILEGNSNVNLADYYLPHAHRVMSGIIQFVDKQQSTSDQDHSTHGTILPIFKNTNIKKKINIELGNDEICVSTEDNKHIIVESYDNKKKRDNLRFKLLTLLRDHHPKGCSKNQLEEVLKKKYSQINRARRGVNDETDEKLHCADLIKRDRTKGRMSYNDKYDIVFINFPISE